VRQNMMRWLRLSTLSLIALVAMGAGSVLPFSSVALAVQSSMPAEEEKNPSEPTSEIKLTHASPRPAPGPALSFVDGTFHRPYNTRQLYATSLFFDPAIALNNGLSSFYRC
jgi:hypothetical protein